MGEGIDFRQFQPQDSSEVFELHHKALEAVGADEGRDSAWDEDFKDIEGVYIKSGGEFVVGTVDGKIVAMGALKILSPTQGEVKRMRVDPSFQKKGYGQTILTKLEEKAKELGLKELILDTGVIQTVAQHLYEKNGYQQFKKEKMGDNEYIFYRKILD